MGSPRTAKHRQSGIALLTTLLLLVLMSAMIIGLIVLASNGQKLSGLDKDQSRAFYGAEGGMEKLTADLGTMFTSNYAPSGAQVDSIQNNPPVLTGDQAIQYADSQGNPAYIISYPKDVNGNPAASFAQITSGSSPFQGMTALETPYTLTVTARTPAGSEVKLQRTLQTVGLPLFQFGVYSETDLSFFPGPNFNFGGRVHTNGSLYLASGGPADATPVDTGKNQLWLAAPVTVVKDVVRDQLSNSHAISTKAEHPGSVEITTGGGAFQALSFGQGSDASNWAQITASYNGNLRNGVRPLPLGIVLVGNGTSQPVDIIRRPVQGENATNPAVLAERYFAQASLKIIISDSKSDITSLPCVSAGDPVNLADLTLPVAAWTSANAIALRNAMIANGTLPLPLAASGATGATYDAGNGYWGPNGTPIVTGFMKIDAQTAYGNPCGSWKDVTLEVLGLGYAGRNLNPVSVAPPTLPALPGAQVAPSTCPDPHPNAIVRLERVRDNPSNFANPEGPCGVAAGVSPPLPADYWPNALFDTREGGRRIAAPVAPFNNRVTLGGVMNYVELDVKNLARWFSGTIGTSGLSTLDNTSAPNNFSVYFSDRRGNFAGGAVGGSWPPLSPAGNETGEFGYSDFVNRADINGCPNNSIETGEDLTGTGTFYTYGEKVSPTFLASLFADNSSIAATVADPNCATGSNGIVPWPGTFLLNANEGRQNPTAIFRRALKLVNGSNINLPLCPGAVSCGLTIAAENPVYVQGDYNANSAGSGFNDHNVASSVVGDAVTLLSNNWNDVNSFASPFSTGRRGGATTWFRMGVVAGKGASFPIPGWDTTALDGSQDFGTDGGVHNFMRFLEGWGSTLHYEGSLVSLFYNRQAVGVYKTGGTVYGAPTRDYRFDTNFLNPSLLPPRTPMFRDVNTTGFTQLLLPTQ
jgi:hypothetical protein